MRRAEIDPAVKARLEECALVDYRKAAGRVIRVREVTAYVDDTDDQDVFQFDPPVLFRVDVDQDRCPQQGLFHWVDEYLDPYWDVTPCPGDPRTEGLRSAYIFGPSYNAITGERESATRDFVGFAGTREVARAFVTGCRRFLGDWIGGRR